MPRLLPSEASVPSVKLEPPVDDGGGSVAVPCSTNAPVNYLSPSGISTSASGSSAAAKKANFIRQKSLNRTMSTSVLSIKKKKGFWEKMKMWEKMNAEKSGTQK